MSYEVSILRRARKALGTIHGPQYEKVKKAIIALGENPRPKGCKKLSGRNGWRVRVGDYRIIYEIEDMKLIVLVVHLGHRREVYR